MAETTQSNQRTYRGDFVVKHDVNALT